MVSNVMGVAAIIASVVGAQFFLTNDPYFWLFMIGVVVVLLAQLPTMFAAKEKQFKRPIGSPKPSLASVFIKIGKGYFIYFYLFLYLFYLFYLFLFIFIYFYIFLFTFILFLFIFFYFYLFLFIFYFLLVLDTCLEQWPKLLFYIFSLGVLILLS